MQEQDQYPVLRARPKIRREVNRAFLNWIARRGCQTCRSVGELHESGEYLVAPSHIKSRGAGGGDSPGNVIGQCYECHHDLHKLGTTLFQFKYEVDLKQIADRQGEEWKRLNP